MKKWLVLLFILMFTFLVACTTGNDESSEGDSGSRIQTQKNRQQIKKKQNRMRNHRVKVAARFSV